MPANTLFFCALLSAVAFFHQPALATPPDSAALQERAKHLEGLIASLEKELAHIRLQLARPPGGKGVTPQEAVEQFKRAPQEAVTVEFGVEPVGDRDVLVREGDDPEPAIWARWDNLLVGGGTLTAIIPPAVFRKLVLPTTEVGKLALTPGEERAQVVKHIETHGVRVSGILEPGGFRGEEFVIRVSDPRDVVLYIKGSGQ